MTNTLSGSYLAKLSLGLGLIGLIAAAYVNLAWAGLTDWPQWWAGLAGVAVVATTMRWG